MLCGNDPAAAGRLTTLDAETVAWFRDWLRWRSLPAEERSRTPEPQRPTAERGANR